MQQRTFGLRGEIVARPRSTPSSKHTPEASWNRSGRQTSHRRGVVAQSDKGKAASYNGSPEEKGLAELKDKWRARFVTDDSSDGEDPLAPEDPYVAELNKEKFWGRIAVIGLGAVLLSERLSGKGIVTALNMAAGVPVWEIEPVLGLLVVGLAAGGIYPVIRRWIARRNGAKINDKDYLPLAVPARKWGDSFQVATGRLAFIALSSTVLAEATTGKGILALLNVETGVEITEIEAGLTFLLLLLFTEDLKAPED